MMYVYRIACLKEGPSLLGEPRAWHEAQEPAHLRVDIVGLFGDFLQSGGTVPVPVQEADELPRLCVIDAALSILALNMGKD